MYPRIWYALKSKEERMSYLEEMTSIPGTPAPILPKARMEKIEAAWEEPASEGDEEASDGEPFDAELIGGDEFYESEDREA